MFIISVGLGGMGFGDQYVNSPNKIYKNTLHIRFWCCWVFTNLEFSLNVLAQVLDNAMESICGFLLIFFLQNEKIYLDFI